MKRRFLSILIVIMMLCSGITVTAFADSEKVTDMPEAVVLVQVSNAECKMVEKMTDLTVDIKLKDGRDVINVPVERVEAQGDDTIALWLGYSMDKIDAQIKADMAEFQKDYHLGSYEEFMDNIFSLLFDAGDAYKDLMAIFDNYEIVINGIPEDTDHEFKIETSTMLITSTIVSELFDIAVGLLGELFELSKDETANINNFSDIITLLNDFLIEEEMLEEGQDIFDLLMESMEDSDISKEELVAAVTEMDEMLDYLRSEEYTGTVFAGVYMDCECPYTVEYTIYHQYFKEVDGKMVLTGTVNNGPLNYEDKYKEMFGEDFTSFFDYEFEKYYYECLSNQIIYAADYVQPEFNGETYNYVGSYGSSTLVWPDMSFFWTDENDYITLDELYAADEWWTEYKYNKIDFSDEDYPSGLVLRYEILEDSTPDTGDTSNMTPFYIIMMLALAVMAAAVATRRRQMN